MRYQGGKSRIAKPIAQIIMQVAGGGQRMPDKQNFNSVIDTERLTVRRLTPLECERLQGFPDGWTDIGAWVGENGKSHAESADTARYKALGNSIALPPWAYVLTRLSLCVGCGHPTMASLFDGIGGFPLIWEWLNGKGSCLWASEIEDFPIAVTKYHFPEEDFYDAVDAKKAAGWRSRKDAHGEWIDLCPACQHPSAASDFGGVI